MRSELSLLFWSAFTLRDHLWHKRHLAGKLATIRSSGEGEDLYPKGGVARYWGSSRRAFDTGPSVSLNINSTTRQQVDWLQRENPDYLLTHPTNVQRLADHCIREGIRIPNLREVQTISEILRPEVRVAAERRGACRCPTCTRAARSATWPSSVPTTSTTTSRPRACLEVLDEDGRACGPGQVGRVIVTQLQNFAMPLLRYDVGDYAEVGEPCPCGRGLPVLARILGREQNMLTLPSGAKRWTLLSSHDIRAFLAMAPIRQYQFVQKTPTSMHVRLVVERRLNEAEETSLGQWAVEKFGYPFRVTFEYLDDLPRQPSGKFQDFVSDVEPGKT